MCWDRALVLWKKNLPDRGLTNVEKPWSRRSISETFRVAYLARGFPASMKSEGLLVNNNIVIQSKYWLPIYLT